MSTVADDKLRVGVLGRILAGTDTGWFIYIKARQEGYYYGRMT
jgi:hypothetical protein